MGTHAVSFQHGCIYFQLTLEQCGGAGCLRMSADIVKTLGITLDSSKTELPEVYS